MDANQSLSSTFRFTRYLGISPFKVLTTSSIDFLLLSRSLSMEFQAAWGVHITLSCSMRGPYRSTG